MTMMDKNNRPGADPNQGRQTESRDPAEFMPPADAPPANARPADARPANATPANSSHEGERDAVFLHDDLDQLRPKWNAIQTRFIDEPRQSVQEADGLVNSTISRLAEIFASERANLEGQWAKGGDVSTEDLRQALRRYRSFFDRLLSV